jgi:hypothetical protein
MNGNKTVTANFTQVGITLIGAIKQNPTAFSGKMVKLIGEFRGWEAGYGSPPVTRNDWLLKDETGYIYINSTTNLRYPADIGKPVAVTGFVKMRNGVPYIEVPRPSIRLNR